MSEEVNDEADEIDKFLTPPGISLDELLQDPKNSLIAEFVSKTIERYRKSLQSQSAYIGGEVPRPYATGGFISGPPNGFLGRYRLPFNSRWTDLEDVGSPYVYIKNTNNIKKENGVKLRESIAEDTPVSRPKASKVICRVHGSKFTLSREDMSWKCKDCNQGRVPFKKWYKETYSLGYIKSHVIKGTEETTIPQEVVITADETFNGVALLINRLEPGVDAHVFVTDLGEVAVDLALKVEKQTDGVRRIELPALYGLGKEDQADNSEGPDYYEED